MKYSLLLSLCAVLLFSGCAGYNGYVPSGWGSGVSMDEGDFKVVKTNVMAEVNCPWLFPMGLNVGPVAFSAGIPLGDPVLFERAMKDLIDKAGANGKNWQFVNVTQELSWTPDFGIYAVQELRLTADVIEFTK
jgi:hypothetical protein